MPSYLPGSPYASNPSPDTPARPPRNVVVELIDFTEERLEPVGDAGESPGVCYHPTRLRTRVPTSTDDDDDGWTTWTAAPRVDETPRASTGKGRQKARKDTRAVHFAALLVREFGRDTLREGRGVVDVAGGSGDLAFQLSVRFGIPCTVVDPRGGTGTGTGAGAGGGGVRLTPSQAPARVARGERRRDRRCVAGGVAAGEAAAAGVGDVRPRKARTTSRLYSTSGSCRTNPPRR